MINNTIDLILQIINKYIKYEDISTESKDTLVQILQDISKTIDISKKLNVIENNKLNINKEYKSKIEEYNKDLNTLQQNCKHSLFERFTDPASAEINYECSICHYTW